MKQFSDLKKIIYDNESFVLSTHINPDADAIGSQLAFYLILNKLGKKIRLINHSITPYNLEFLDEEKIIEKYDVITHQNVFNETDVIVLLDLNQAGRIVSMENAFRSFKGIKVCIDHHQNSENVFDYFFGGTQYCATSEIIYDFIEETKIVSLDYGIALQLYAGIMTDTGSFNFERTTARIHEITAKLLETGINPTEVFDKIYNQFNFGRVKLLGEALKSVELDSSGKIAYMFISRNSLEKNGTTEADIDGFVNYCLTIQNVQIGILFYELKNGIKISFRSKGNVDVNKLAKEFGGGGHINASGTRFYNTTYNEIKNKVIEAAQRIL